MKKLIAGVILGLVTTAAAAATTPTMEEMWAIIQQQQAEIAQLKAQLASADEEIKETSDKVEATASRVEEGITSGGETLASSWTERTQIGSYGEMHYNNLEDKNDTGDDKDELDFHRFVIYLGHDFTDTTRMFSEIELEHSVAGDDQNGEVELEQASVGPHLRNRTRTEAG